MATDRRRRRAEPTDDWDQLELLCGWPEQRDYELIRPMVLFGSPASERAKETGAASERTLQRRAARYEVEVEAATGRLREVGRPRLFEAPVARPQQRLFALDDLGEGGWLKTMRLEGYAPRAPRGARSLQQALFPYA
jgi:hypothetical protein